MMQPVLED